MLKQIKYFLSEYEEYNVEGLTFLNKFSMHPFSSQIFVCESPNWDAWGTTFALYREYDAVIILNTDLYENIPKLVETCSHECFHAVYQLLGKAFKSPIADNSEEIYAHFIGNLSRKVFNIAVDSKTFDGANKFKKKKATSSRKSKSKK